VHIESTTSPWILDIPSQKEVQKKRTEKDREKMIMDLKRVYTKRDLKF